jgi:hypothetical protein
MAGVNGKSFQLKTITRTMLEQCTADSLRPILGTDGSFTQANVKLRLQFPSRQHKSEINCSFNQAKANQK